MSIAQQQITHTYGPTVEAQNACESVLSACRAAPSHATPVDCRGVTIEGPCPVTVSQYLACADAFQNAITCQTAGYRIPTPAACEAVQSTCPSLGSFNRDGKPPPCAADAGAGSSVSPDYVHGLDGCRPTPTRFVVLGDSIADCVSAGVDATSCGPDLIAARIRATYASSLVFESHALAGARVGDLPSQASAVAGGPGHVFVWIYAIGNDLLAGNIDYPEWSRDFDEVFAWFSDTTRFPDGATFLMNTQYSPYDECNAPPLEHTLREANQRVFLDGYASRSDTVVVDQYTSFLGHGEHANDAACPHCGADNSSWLSLDGIHPSALGYAHIAENWDLAIDAMLGARCRDGGSTTE
jgi:hypothetical protein